jgi:DNA-binding MarR family transcriptional regulator
MSASMRTTQFSILAKLRRLGPVTINALAADLVMDRTTLGRNILPLERDGLIAVEKGRHDRRSEAFRVTEAGTSRFLEAAKGWALAQRQFEAPFGAERTVGGGVAGGPRHHRQPRNRPAMGAQVRSTFRRRLPRVGDKWHLDEVVLKIAGVKHWLWRAVDQAGVVLDVLV